MLGFYNVIKPTGINSTTVVGLVKRTSKHKAGHLGTLDPMAGGVLPVAVGRATKLFDYFLNKDKKYFAIVLFGTQTDTLDSEGNIICQQQVNIKKTQIEAILGEFLGKTSQIPPDYSSVHVGGQRAYNLARSGKQVQLQPREINIYSLNLVRQVADNMFAFSLHCSAGTYVRALFRDIAARLNTVATTTCIIRTSSGKFNADTACSMAQLKDGTARLVQVQEVVDLPQVKLPQLIVDRMLNGQIPNLSNMQLADGEYLAFNAQNKVVGIINLNSDVAKLKVNLWEA